MNFSPTQYRLMSVATGTHRADEGWTQDFPNEISSLIRTKYSRKQLRIRNDLDGLYRFADWLPLQRILKGSAAPVTYRSQHLAAELGLKNLWITFNGWWPEKGAFMRTGTFKECEAYSVCARMDENFDRILVVASAGNTGRAFARVCSDNAIPLLLFVPEDNLSALWFDKPIADCVRLISPVSGGDYFDAIRMANVIASGSPRCIAEGGAKNIARRDGMGSTLLSAVSTMGHIPDVYIQAVGSGTGAIAAWEAAMRFEQDGRFGTNRMRLIVSQNEPFTPIADSWNANSREFLVADDAAARRLAMQVHAKVLTNRRPPWSIPGGLYDALQASAGTVLTATNAETMTAAELFSRLEGNDVSPAAAVAVASLLKAVQQGHVTSDEKIMLNITGGGMQRIAAEHDLHSLKPHRLLDLNSPDSEIVTVCEDVFNLGANL